MKNKLILLMWVSGSGKTTLLTELLQTHSQLVLVPSYTTRPIRPNEKNGRKYWHVDEKAFNDMIEHSEFMEYALVHNKYNYWTKTSEVKKAFDKWMVPITEVDMNWLEKIKKDSKWIDFVSIFLDLPAEIMMERINLRWSVTQEEIDRRINSAKTERVKAKEICDYIMSTDDTIKNNLKNINQIIKKILND